MPRIPAMHEDEPDGIPAMNEITRQALGEDPEYPDDHESKRYMILFPEDYQGHGTDVAGNVALLLDEDNAREVKRLAEDILDDLEGDEVGPSGGGPE